MHKRKMLVDVNPRLVSVANVMFLQFTISIYVKVYLGVFLFTLIKFSIFFQKTRHRGSLFIIDRYRHPIIELRKFSASNNENK
jgi:hypothetical protein